jgi:hypothetical protein
MPNDDDLWYDRLGGAAAIAGALVGLVGNLVHPQTPPESEGTAQIIAASDSWVPVHIALVLAFPLMLWGLAAIRRGLLRGISGALADFALSPRSSEAPPGSSSSASMASPSRTSLTCSLNQTLNGSSISRRTMQPRRSPSRC